jgi:hypothetical protein
MRKYSIAVVLAALLQTAQPSQALTGGRYTFSAYTMLVYPATFRSGWVVSLFWTGPFCDLYTYVFKIPVAPTPPWVSAPGAR